MADNVEITAGTGTVIATDEISGEHFQRVKVVIGGDGVDDGDVASGNPLPVTGTITAELGSTDNAVLDAIAASTGTLAGAVSDGQVQVDIVASAAVPVTDNSGSLTVDAPVSTPVFVRLSDGASAITTLPVSLASVPSHAVTNAGTFPVQVDGSALTALQLIDDAVIADDAAFTIGTSKVMMAGGTVDEASTDSADEGDAVALRATANRQLIVTVRPNASGEGLDIFRSLDLDETEEDIKTSPGKLYGYFIFNAASGTRFVKFYNATAANVTVGSTTPVLTVPIPAGSAANVEFTNGIPFSTAMSAAATTGVADNDTGAPGANEVIVNVFYK